jgi:hypothetical protein
MKSVIYQLQSDEFPRIRIGIGNAPEGWDLADYVLGRFNADEAGIICKSIEMAAEAAITIVESGIITAMNLYNGNRHIPGRLKELTRTEGFMINFINPLLELEEYRQVLSNAKSYTAPVNITGLSESQKAHICHALCCHSGYKGIFVTFNEMQARKLFEDFTFFWGDMSFFTRIKR